MLSRRQFYAEWIKRAFKGRLALAQTISGAVMVGVTIAAYFWRPEGREMSLVAPSIFFAVFLATLVIGMLRAPFGIYLDEASKVAQSFKDASSENSALSAQLENLRSQLDSRDRMRKCANELSPLIIEGRGWLNNTKDDLRESGADWRQRVLGVLERYWPTAAADFRTMHSRPPSGAHRDMLREELGKLDGFMVTLRNVV